MFGLDHIFSPSVLISYFFGLYLLLPHLSHVYPLTLPNHQLNSHQSHVFIYAYLIRSNKGVCLCNHHKVLFVMFKNTLHFK